MRSLFGSQTSFELLNLLTKEGSVRYYLNELTKELRKDPANILRELGKLQKEGVVQVESEGEKKYYRLNESYVAAAEIRQLFHKLRLGDFDQKFGGTWILAEDVPNIDPFFSKTWLNCFVDEFASPGGKAYQKIAAIYKDYHLWFYYDEVDAHAVGEHLVKKMFADPAFMEEANAQIVFHSDALRAFSETIPEERLDQLSNEQLWKYWEDHDRIHTAYYQWGWIPVAADMFGNNMTEAGKTLLRAKGVDEDHVNDYLVTLNQPTTASLVKKEQDDLAAIGVKIQSDPKQYALVRELFRKFKEEDVKLFKLYEHSPQYEEKFDEAVRALVEDIRPDILQDLQKHYTEYYYTKFLFTEEQGVYSFEHFLKLLVRLVSGDQNIAATLTKESEELTALKEKTNALADQLKLTAEERTIFRAWGDFMVTKIYRRYAQIYVLYRMLPIIEETSRRLGLSVKETKFMMHEEVEEALLRGNIDTANMKRRVSFSVYYADATVREFYTENDAEKATRLIQKEHFELVDKIKGQCGCQGSARGIVRVVNVIEDMNKLKTGEILVSICTQPDLIPAMKRAAAFVTDQGGVTSHAAIVAREMQKPCVIGTKFATKMLKDGDEVEVDATRGIVTVIKRT